MNSVLNHDDYRAFLRAALEEGIRQNPAFSLRAFARKCDLTPSYLSRVLNSQRRLSATHAARLARALGLDPEESDYLLRLVSQGEDAAPPANKSRLLEMESFQAIAEWQHFAILALTKTRQFRAEPAWISARLGISQATAKLALERLVALGFLQKEGKRWIAKDEGNFETPHDVASSAVRENHRQHLSLATKALDEVSVEMREFTNASISMRLRDLPQAKRRIRQFMDKFIRDFETEAGEEVMQVNLQMYPLSKIEKGRA